MASQLSGWLELLTLPSESRQQWPSREGGRGLAHPELCCQICLCLFWFLCTTWKQMCSSPSCSVSDLHGGGVAAVVMGEGCVYMCMYVCMCVHICVYMFVCVCVYVCMLSHFNHVQLLVMPWTGAPRLLCLWDSPGKNIGVGCHTLLQGTFPIYGLNKGLLHCRWILYHLSYQRSPRTLGYPFYRGSS